MPKHNPPSGPAWGVEGCESEPSIPRPTTAYESLLDRLRADGGKVLDHGRYATAACPGHEDRDPSLAVYCKPGRVKLVCFSGCDAALDVLPALGLSVADMYDTPAGNRRPFRPDPAIEARVLARRGMTTLQRALDDLLHRLDLGERLVRCIALAEARDWWGLAAEYQDERPEVALACRRHAAFLAYLAGQPLEDPGVTE
jgi:hypothetical protein